MLSTPNMLSPAALLECCRRIVVTQERLLRDADPGSLQKLDGVGAGGDTALILDRRFEAIAVKELAALATPIRVLSEELGEVKLGVGKHQLIALIDPVDGSANARRAIPCYAFSVAILSGHTLDDIEFGFVYDHGSRSEYWASRDGGAFLNGTLIERRHDLNRGIDLVAIESVESDIAGMTSLASDVRLLVGNEYRPRIFGSTAIAMCHFAAGHVDAVVSEAACRSIDIAAGALICREADRPTTVVGPDSLTESLDRNYRLVGSADPRFRERFERSWKDVPE